MRTDTDKEIDLLRKKNEELEEQFEGLKKEIASLNIVQLREENLELKQALTELQPFQEFMEDFMTKNPDKFKQEGKGIKRIPTKEK